MKFSTKSVGCCGVVLSAAMLFAQAETPKAVEAPKTIKIVTLEGDESNTTVVASAALGEKPRTVSFSADALVQSAAKPAAPTISSDALTTAASDVRGRDEAPASTSKVKALVTEGTVIPPSSEQAKTVEDAIRWILRDAKKQAATVSSNGIEQLTMPYQQIGDGKSYETEWRKAVRLMLSPLGWNFTEDGDLVLFGMADEVDAKHKVLQQEQLSGNRTPIVFTTSGEGMELRNAIRDIALKAGVTITTDYMEPADLYVPVAANAEVGQLSAADIGKANDKAKQQQVQVKRTTFDTNGQSVEWRIVLREVLNPHDYDFVEMGGVVRVAKRAKIAGWAKEVEMAKPLSARVVKIYHADPESVVERVTKLKVLKHPNAQIQAVSKKEDRADIFRGSQSGVTVASGTRMGASSIGNSSSFSSLRRPRIPPAIVVYDLEENLDAVEAKIRLFDIRERQVLIEAIIFDVNDDNGPNGDMTGINWGEALQNLSLANGAYSHAFEYSDLRSTAKNIVTTRDKIDNTVSGIEDAFDYLKAPPDDVAHNKNDKTTKRDYTYDRNNHYDRHYERNRKNENTFKVTFGPIDFQMVIDLILERDDSRLLSNPMVVIGDHSESVIQVGEATPIPMTKTTVMASNGGAYSNQDTEWQILMTGIMLWVSPEITSDGKSVRLSVHPQITTPGDMVFDQFGQGYPKVSSQELDTRVTIKSGDSLLLGGLIQTKDSEKEKRIWLLGDIPWIGRFFRWNVKTKDRSNLMVLIRPTILDDETPDTGYEKPTLKYTDKMVETLGKNLKLYNMNVDDAMTTREMKLEESMGIKKKEEETTDTEIKPVEAAKEDKQ